MALAWSIFLGHQASLPLENLLIHNQKPIPSYTSILSAIRRLLVKTKTAPAIGSDFR
jgi:hypothetical protein